MVNPRDLPAVLRKALELGLRQVWVGPGTVAQLGLEIGPDKWLRAAEGAGWETPPAILPWLEFRRGTERLELVFPSWDDGNPFRAAGTPRQLIDALELYATHLRLRYRWSPGASGLALMRAVHSGPGGIALELSPVLPPPAISPAAHGPLEAYIGATMPAEGWVHCWDLNAQYLAACSSVELGFGEPVHVKGGGELLGTRAGYWRARVDGPAPAVPPPFPMDGKAHWYAGESLALALELGAGVQTLEAWTFPQRRRWLTPWYERLRDARAALAADGSPAALLALTAVKATYTWALGRLAGSWLQPGDSTFRPDWRHAIIARARANMYRHLRRVAALPLASNADAVAYACAFTNADAAAQFLGLEVSPQLGKWKHVGSLTAQEARAAVGGKKSPAGRLRALLAALEASGGSL